MDSRDKNLRADEWNSAYEKQETPWDLSTPTPEFIRLATSGQFGKSSRVLFPGAGRAHDPIAFAKLGFHATALDFAPKALTEAHEAAIKAGGQENKTEIFFPNGGTLALVTADLFSWCREKQQSSRFDYVAEQTIFCAIHPSQRRAFAEAMQAALKPKGQIFSMLFPLEKREGGPPYGISLEDVHSAYQGLFQIEVKEAEESIKPRKGREKLGILTSLKLASLALAASFFSFSPAVQAETKLQLKNPIVLVHGASMGGAVLRVGPLRLGDYWYGIPEFLTAEGNEVGIAQLTTNSSIAERALILKNYLELKFKGRQVNIIAHSMGGLDSRFLVSVLRSKQVASITGIATPHRGSPLADWAFQETEARGLWYWLLRLFGYDLRERRFVPELRMSYMKNQFNPKVVDSPNVRYYSVLAWGTPFAASLSPLLYSTYWYTKNFLPEMTAEKNDGLVPLSSQSWGTVITEVELDHLGQINHHTFRPSLEETSLGLYRKILERLQADGL
jgi:triacylglycerol lipase